MFFPGRDDRISLLYCSCITLAGLIIVAGTIDVIAQIPVVRHFLPIYCQRLIIRFSLKSKICHIHSGITECRVTVRNKDYKCCSSRIQIILFIGKLQSMIPVGAAICRQLLNSFFYFAS